MFNKKIGSRPASYIRNEKSGLFSSFGPYIGIIKNNIDPTASGRLQVYIPSKGSLDENNPSNWVTVNYASPFRGQTRQRNDLNWYTDYGIDFTQTVGFIQENSFQSYGFWFVPPDLNGRVLCFFVNGDPSQGYWTSCIQDSMDSHMIPAIGAVPAAKENNPNAGGYIWQPSGPNPIPSHTMLQDYIQISGNGKKEIPYRLPVSEPVLVDQKNSNPSTPLGVLMVPQVYQTLQLGIQGLAFDFIRGSTSASSVRENPSQVFGISTPGRLTSFANVKLSEEVISEIRSYLNNPQQNPSSQTNLEKLLGCSYRTGGHQFVMDDGSISGQDQGIRIRTTGGNEILMDDTNGQIYIINGPGTAWIELSPSGFVDIYSSNDYSVRSQGNINFHADKNIYLNAAESVEIHSGKDIFIESDGAVTSLSSKGVKLYDESKIELGTIGPIGMSGTTTEINSGTLFSVQTTSLQLPGVAPTVSKPNSIQKK